MNKIKQNHKDLIKVDNLSIDFQTSKGVASVVNKLSFHIKQGEIFSIVGESGSGKSITALSILRLLDGTSAQYPSGRIFYNDKNILELKPCDVMSIRGKEMSMIFQEPMTSLNPLHTIYKQITEVINLNQIVTKKEAHDLCLKLLDDVGLEILKDRLHTYPHELSGGQRQRIMIAMAIACKPKLLIADEPTTALDVTTQQKILDLLLNLREKYNMAILLITHDLGVVRKISDRTLVINKGEMVETGLTKELFANPQKEYTQILINSEAKGSAIALEKDNKNLLNINELFVKYVTGRNFFGKPIKFVNALSNISFNLKESETLGIVGESGSGKSTLAMAILRLIKSDGEINFQNTRIDKLNQKQMQPFRNEIQVVFQDPFASLNPRMSVSQIIGEGLEAHKIGKNKQERQALIEQSLTEVGLTKEMSQRYPHEFSGGQRQRIAIARAIALNPKLIMLDEPTSALDLTVQAQIIELLRKLQKDKKLSYIFISHDLKVVKALSHRIIVLKNGNKIESGNCEDIFNNPKDEYTKTLIDAALT